MKNQVITKKFTKSSATLAPYRRRNYNSNQMAEEKKKNFPLWKKVIGIFNFKNAPAAASLPSLIKSPNHIQSSITTKKPSSINAQPKIQSNDLGELVDGASMEPAKKGLTRYQQHQKRVVLLAGEVNKHRPAKRRKPIKRPRSVNPITATKPKNRKMGELGRMLAHANEYKDSLRLKKMQCHDTWGVFNAEKWQEIRCDFITKVIKPWLVKNPSDLKGWNWWIEEIDKIAGPATVQKTRTPTTKLGTTFEFEIAARLRELGWNVQMLGQTGDQGGDLLAHKQGKSVVVQCKNFSAKVGNGAVQEVAAGAQFYNVSIAVVVAKNGFTKSAHALAEKTSVLLLLPNQLTILDDFGQK